MCKRRKRREEGRGEVRSRVKEIELKLRGSGDGCVFVAERRIELRKRFGTGDVGRWIRNGLNAFEYAFHSPCRRYRY